MIKNIEEQYLDLVRDILENGELKHNRTGVDTLMIPGAMLKHDMSKGFPLLTTRKLPFQSTKLELEFFLKGMTNKRWLEDRGCKYWRYWHSNQHKNFLDIPDSQYAIDDNDLGPLGYSFGWRNFGGDYVKIPTIHTPFNKTINIEKNENNDLIGKEFSGKYGNFIVEKLISKHSGRKKDKTDTPAKYQICFIKTGYRAIHCKHTILRKKAKDYYFPCLFGVACSGIYDKNYPNIKQIYTNWSCMINRCFNPKQDSYFYYGNRGISVCNKWLVFEYYLEDYKKLLLEFPNLKQPSLERIDINGDYEPNNCKLIERNKQSINRRRSHWIDLYKNNQLVRSEISTEEVQKITGLTRYSIYRHLDKKDYHGWQMISHKNSYKTVENGVDQLKNIVSELKINPTSRRMLCSAWDIKNIDKMALPPCHLLWQVMVTNNKLSLAFYMRSSDVICGLPQNLCSYAILLHLLAKESGFQEGELIAFLSDTHLYKNHEKGAREQITRIPRELPQIQTDNFTSIFDWQYTDTNLTNYNPYPSIKFEVAV